MNWTHRPVISLPERKHKTHDFCVGTMSAEIGKLQVDEDVFLCSYSVARSKVNAENT